MSTWPRLRDLPENERIAFSHWLGPQPRPLLNGLSQSEQDGYYPWDLVAWRNTNPDHRLISFIKFRFDETDVDTAMASIGAECLDKIHVRRPSGIRLADYKIGNHAIELKTIKNEPLDILTRQKKLEEFVVGHKLNGESILNESQNHEYWIKIIGAPIQRAIADAAEQIQGTREFLQAPNLIGGVLIMNTGADMIDATSFHNLALFYSKRHAPSINLVATFSLIPTVVSGHEKPLLPFFWDIFSAESRACANDMEQAVHKQISIRAGKALESAELRPNDKMKTIRGPYNIVTDGGQISVR